jgi:archaemetzincin
MTKCEHSTPHLDLSPHAATTKYERLSLARRHTATTPSGRATNNKEILEQHANVESLFPPPLVLPDDALAIAPENSPPQSLRSWTLDKNRNPVTPQRRTIYVVSPPKRAFEIGMPRCLPPEPTMIAEWRLPPDADPEVAKSDLVVDEVRDYLAAFYHPLPVKRIPGHVEFVPWSDDEEEEDEEEKSHGNQYIGLQIGDGITRITTRPCPDKRYEEQLRISDLLDAAEAALPDDAYALMMVLWDDLYEDDDDEFCCGRAYGGNRVAVVSGARYHPVLDRFREDNEHDWPFSHCSEFVKKACQEANGGNSSRNTNNKRQKTARNGALGAIQQDTPGHTTMMAMIRAALDAEEAPKALPFRHYSALWIFRVARTAAHEVGHCFCLEHCSYYACVMQDTASLAEDLRQPPYLCPVCLAKLSRAIGDGAGVTAGGAPSDSKNDIDTAFCINRYKALVQFCTRWEIVPMFAAYRCWLEQRIAVLQSE